MKENKDALKGKKAVKSLNTKLEELNKSRWVSTGNFRNEEKIDDKVFKELENNIIKTTRASQDDLLNNAAGEVNKALRDPDGYEPLGEASIGNTFEIPKLDIHFGDTGEIKDVRKLSRDAREKNIKDEIDKIDLSKSIEEQTAKEMAERDNAEMLDKAFKAKKRSGKSSSGKKDIKGDTGIAERPKKKTGITEEAAERPKKRTKNTEGTAERPGKRTKDAEDRIDDTKKRRRKRPAEDEDKVIIQSEELKTRRKKKRPAAETEEPGKRTKKKTSESRSSGKAADKDTADKKTSGKKTADTKTPDKKTAGTRTRGKKTADTKTPGKKTTDRRISDKKTAGRKTADKTLSDKKASGRNSFEDKEWPSDFRKKSADWKDVETVEKAARLSLFKQRSDAIRARIKKMTPIQWSMVAMAFIIFITGIMTSAVYANYQGEQNKARALASLNQYKEDESYAAAVETVTEEMLPEAVGEPEPAQAKILSLEMSSVEKDLKIKLVDEEDTLVKDVSWSVTVTGESGEGGDAGKSEVYEDDDRDGIIYINNIAAGEYAVALNPSDSLADYVLPQDKQLVSVKATIEYKVIANIRDEIKSEKEVNVALEDPNGNQAADVETGTALADTVEWCESTKTANGEEYVEATPDLTKTAASVKKKDAGFMAALERLGRNGRTAVSSRSVIGFSLPAGYKVATIDDGNNDSDKSDDSNDDELVIDNPDPTPTPEPTLSIKINGDNTVNTGSSIELRALDVPDGASVSWEIESDGGEASITSEGRTCKLTGDKEGTVILSATCGYDGSFVTVTKKIKVKGKASSDSSEASLSISGSGSIIVGASTTLTASFKPDDTEVTWSTSDSSIVSISSTDDKGKKCTVKGEKTGSVTITASGSNGKSTTLTVTVKEADGNYSDDAKLYDASKNALYIRDGDSYRLATYGDYKSGSYSVYYRKQEGYLYTGWQTIDGKTYYFKSDHTFVTGEQIIQGIKYSFGSDGVLATGSGTLGIDVSKYQPSINWSSVKASGVNFVIIRCGYRGASTGVLIQDPYFTSHIKGAKAAGLKVGVYFFTTALTEAEAVEEASMCAELCSGYGINYPIFMDCENSSRPGYNSMSASERTTIIKAFCNTIKSAGYTPGVYANKTWLSSYINTSALSGCRIWLAQYNASGPTYNGHYDIWQYTSKGHVDGISGNVDMNQSYMGY